MVEIVMAIISIVAMFIPNLADDLEERYLRKKRNIAPGQIYSMIDEALTQISVKGQATAQKFLNKLSTALMTLNTAGSQTYADYINKARSKNLEKQQQITAKSIEASVSEQAANTLANAYESMSSRNKDSQSGKALREGVKSNINRAVDAYKEVDPTIDTSNLQEIIKKYDAVEQPVDKEEQWNKWHDKSVGIVKNDEDNKDKQKGNLFDAKNIFKKQK